MKTDIGYDHEFSEDELSKMSDEMRDAVLTVDENQKEKKVQDSIFNEKIKTNQDRAIKLANKVKDGTEIRYALCERVVNRQKQRVEWVDQETLDVRKTEPMEEADYQEVMDLPEVGDVDYVEPEGEESTEEIDSGADVTEAPSSDEEPVEEPNPIPDDDNMVSGGPVEDSGDDTLNTLQGPSETGGHTLPDEQ